MALICLAQEEDETVLDEKFNRFDVVIMRHDAALVEQEVEEAIRLQRELEAEAKRRFRAAKKEEISEQVEARRNKMKASFESLKQKYSGD